jgi:pimeloyl-ACP methyl ester carboxylesterase
MPTFVSDGVEIWFDDVGAGDPVVLVHGWGSTAQHNFGDTGWVEMLSSRFRVIAIDCRGHGRSARPHREDLYGRAQMASDVIRLLDHLGIARTLIMGYSMGASLVIELLMKHPNRLRAAVLGGIAYDDGIEDPALRSAISEALIAPSQDGIKDPVARAYRRFAESTGNDLFALAAIISAPRQFIDPRELARIRVPTLIVVGENDDAIGPHDELPEMIPASRIVKLEGRDHMTAPSDPRFKDEVAEFLAISPP